MASKLKISSERIIAALGGVPISGLIEGWSFRMEEVSPFVFKAYGEHSNHGMVIGSGGAAESALADCIRKIEKISLREQRRTKLEKALSKIGVVIKNIFDS